LNNSDVKSKSLHIPLKKNVYNIVELHIIYLFHLVYQYNIMIFGYWIDLYTLKFLYL